MKKNYFILFLCLLVSIMIGLIIVGSGCGDEDLCEGVSCPICQECNPANGDCMSSYTDPDTEITYTTDGQSCMSSNPCLEEGVCSGGNCQPGPQRDCSDNNPCTINERCDPSTGACLSDPKDCGICKECDPETGDCIAEDCGGDPCKACQFDTGLCEPIDCSFEGQCYSCQVIGDEVGCFPDDSLSCDNEDPCTTGDYCEQGLCISGPEMECPDCKSCSGGECMANVLANGASCDDGNLCTINDVCSDGYCIGTQKCTQVCEECDPQNGACMVKQCLGTSVCNYDTGNCEAGSGGDCTISEGTNGGCASGLVCCWGTCMTSEECDLVDCPDATTPCEWSYEIEGTYYPQKSCCDDMYETCDTTGCIFV